MRPIRLTEVNRTAVILTLITITMLLTVAACGGADQEEVEHQVDQSVRATVFAMPSPTPDPEEIDRLAAQAAKVALAAMPTPAPNQTEVFQLVERAIQSTLVAMPTWTPAAIVKQVTVQPQVVEKIVKETVVVEKRETVVVEKPVPVTVTPSSTPTATPTPEIRVPTLAPGTEAEWFVRVYNVDEEAEAHVNGEVVANVERARDTGWLDVTDRIVSGQPNTVRFITRNFTEEYTWGFAIKRDDLVVWEDKQGDLGLRGANDNDMTRTNQMMYDRTVVIKANGQVTLHPASQHEWLVAMWGIDDQGTIYLNGEPVTWLPSGGNTDGIDISNWILDGVENSLRFTTWNDRYSGLWNFALARAGEVVWEESGESEQRDRYVFDETLFITRAGRVSTTSEQTRWYARIYAVDDLGRFSGNGQPVLEARHGDRDTGWIDITRHITADDNNRLRFSAWNGRGEGNWQVALRRDNSIIWEETGRNDSTHQMIYDYLIFMDPEGEISADSTDSRWLVRVYDNDDQGNVYVNGEKVFEEENQTGDWIDITDLMEPDEDNTVRFTNWNDRGLARWRFAVRRNNNIVWEETGEKPNTSENHNRIVYDETLTITANGELED